MTVITVRIHRPSSTMQPHHHQLPSYPQPQPQSHPQSHHQSHPHLHLHQYQHLNPHPYPHPHQAEHQYEHHLAPAPPLVNTDNTNSMHHPLSLQMRHTSTAPSSMSLPHALHPVSTPPLTPVTAPPTPTAPVTPTASAVGTPTPGGVTPSHPTMTSHHHDHRATALFRDFESPAPVSSVNNTAAGRIVTDSFEAEAESIIRALDDALEARRTHEVPSLGVRTAVELLPECNNPLEKDGRNTVIRGRLPHTHPFAVASQDLGYRLVSPQYTSYSCQSGECSTRTRMRLFLLDCNAVYRQLKGNDIKVPIIGGGPLDLFKLQQEVLLLGGLHNVVDKRAFRIVAQQLELPATCTSAAYVLKGTYERFLYHYEQLFVFGAWPQDGGAQTINMRSLITQQRERAKRSNLTPPPSNGHQHQHQSQNEVHHTHSQMQQQTAEPHNRHQYPHHQTRSQSQSTTIITTNGQIQARSQAQTQAPKGHSQYINNHHNKTNNSNTDGTNNNQRSDQHRKSSQPQSQPHNKQLNSLSSLMHPPGMPAHLARSKDTTHPGLGISPASLYTQLTVGIGNGPNSSGLCLGNVNQVAADLALPRWALELPSDDAYDALVRAACNVEKRGQGKLLQRLFTCTSQKEVLNRNKDKRVQPLKQRAHKKRLRVGSRKSECEGESKVIKNVVNQHGRHLRKSYEGQSIQLKRHHHYNQLHLSSTNQVINGATSSSQSTIPEDVDDDNSQSDHEYIFHFDSFLSTGSLYASKINAPQKDKPSTDSTLTPLSS